MKLIVFVPFFFLIVHQTSSFLFNFDPAWNTLRLTWGLPIFQSNAFNKMPLTAEEAKKEGFVRTDDGPCSGKFTGNGYYKPGDLSVVLLYDVNGYIAGVQMNYVKSLMLNNVTKRFVEGDMFFDNTLGGIDTYAVTAYLVDPAIICNGGRTKAQFDAAVGGTELSFQTKGHLIKVPLKQEDTEKIPIWTPGRCIVSMGRHFVYNTSLNMECHIYKPIFLLYNHGKLTGFGFAVFGRLENSGRYEHPPALGLQLTYATLPKCVPEWADKLGGVTTVHVYMNTMPWNLIC